MYLLKLWLFGLAVLFGAAASVERSSTETVLVPNSWVVWLKDDAEKHPSEHSGWANSLHEENHGGFRGVTHVFDLTYIRKKGYTGEFTDGVVEKIRQDKDVDHVSQEFLVPLEDFEKSPLVTEEERKLVAERHKKALQKYGRDIASDGNRPT